VPLVSFLWQLDTRNDPRIPHLLDVVADGISRTTTPDWLNWLPQSVPGTGSPVLARPPTAPKSKIRPPKRHSSGTKVFTGCLFPETICRETGCFVRAE
jgi:hypothetical protein